MGFFTDSLVKAFQSFLRILRRFNPFNQSSDWTSLTVLPGIGFKNGQLFFQAGFKTPQDILNATDEELLQIRGVGRTFIKRLRTYQ